MKITKVEPIMTGWRRMFVKVYTDEGIVGVGEGGNWGFRESMVGAIHRMEEPLLGQDPLRIEYLDSELYSRFKFGGTSIAAAISAIDIALWDIKGKYFNVPIYQMLGGAVRNKIRLWGVVFGKTIDESVECARKLKEEGYTCIRLNPTNIKEASGTYARRERAMSDMIHAVREAVGDDVDIGCEIHRSLQPHESVRLMQLVEDVNLLFFEDPINYENYQTILGFLADIEAVKQAAAGRDDADRAKLICDYVADRLAYDSSYQLNSLGDALRTGVSACVGYNSMTELLFEHCGLSYVNVVGEEKNGPMQHIFGMAKIASTWLVFDTTNYDRDSGKEPFWIFSDQYREGMFYKNLQLVESVDG